MASVVFSNFHQNMNNTTDYGRPLRKSPSLHRPKINSQSQIFRYGPSIFYMPHRPKFSDFFDLCLHWVSVVRELHRVFPCVTLLSVLEKSFVIEICVGENWNYVLDYLVFIYYFIISYCLLKPCVVEICVLHRLVYFMKLTKARNFCLLFSLALILLFSSCQLLKKKTSLFEWKNHHFSLKRWSFYPISLFEQKKMSFDNFFMTTWEQENEIERKKEPQMPA